VGEYIDPEAAEVAAARVTDRVFWKVVAVVHQRPPATSDARVYVELADPLEILDIFEPPEDIGDEG
jgi:hypothetical protein